MPSVATGAVTALVDVVTPATPFNVSMPSVATGAVTFSFVLIGIPAIAEEVSMPSVATGAVTSPIAKTFAPSN